ncbi:hypothetical protein PAAG_12611 [Paracoccidioides lutzii Pb01]|uniref:Uncharacterized protein n=1 Tax=Paracoccidioides lutzii (strain ATCC MYA-826 / Pb01) TaxID=502779 RepID=A0A0A2VII9_PARBA|nr:hypothetical protein PAAG_12611 [Paracoccidioides lutzii Pb01]KGQ00719.1 hypothetical protein PAAG_12611 [Paracoccidioides lutzii Pb01]
MSIAAKVMAMNEKLVDMDTQKFQRQRNDNHTINEAEPWRLLRLFTAYENVRSSSAPTNAMNACER